MHKQQLALVYVSLGEVQHRLHGGALQRQMPIAGWGDHEVKVLWRRVLVLHFQILSCDLCH